MDSPFSINRSVRVVKLKQNDRSDRASIILFTRTATGKTVNVRLCVVKSLIVVNHYLRVYKAKWTRASSTPPL